MLERLVLYWDCHTAGADRRLNDSEARPPRPGTLGLSFLDIRRYLFPAAATGLRCPILALVVREAYLGI